MQPSASDIDPEIRAAQARLAERVPPYDPLALPVAEQRRLAAAVAAFWADGLPELPRVETLSIPGPAGPMRARLYWPASQGTGAILYFHGGGWTNGDVDSHDRTMRCLARDSGLMVMGVDYRLAPEHPYPAGLDDCRAAWRWLAAEAPRLGLDPARLAVSGDSAGANLALGVCVAERDAGGPVPAAGALFYGCFAPIFDTDSHRANGDGRFGLSTERMRWYWTNFVGPDHASVPAPAAPLRAALAGLPYLYLALAELDPLADDTRLLAGRLTEAGVPHDLDTWPGAVHGFLQMTRDVAIARAAVAKGAQALARRLAG